MLLHAKTWHVLMERHYYLWVLVLSYLFSSLTYRIHLFANGWWSLCSGSPNYFNVMWQHMRFICVYLLYTLINRERMLKYSFGLFYSSSHRIKSKSGSLKSVLLEFQHQQSSPLVTHSETRSRLELGTSLVYPQTASLLRMVSLSG